MDDFDLEKAGKRGAEAGEKLRNQLLGIKSKDFKENPVMSYNISMLNWNIAIEDRKCPTCGIELIEKGDWIFCPKNSTEIPDCDSSYHIAKNIKTGQGWSTLDT